MIEGKTIARVIEDSDSPWIVFTDGTGIRISGYEGADYSEVTPEEVAEREAELAQRALDADRQRAYHESWMLRTCEERGELRSQWVQGRAEGGLVFPAFLEDVFMDEMVWSANHPLFGGQRTPKARCPVCNERACPNAPDMEPPNRGLVHVAGTITIPVKKGAAT